VRALRAAGATGLLGRLLPRSRIYNIVDQSSAQELLAGEFILTMRQALPALGCSTTWPVAQSSLAGTLPGEFVPDAFAISMQGAFVTLDYFIHIATE
jgi:hypothetical protein